MTRKDCEIRKEAVETQQVKSVNNMSCAVALKRAQSEKGGGETGETGGPGVQKVQTRTGASGVERSASVIADVMNCSDQLRHKTEKIKVTVKNSKA